MNGIRPPSYWNFFEDGNEQDRVKHVLRYNANPMQSYQDGRIEDILQNIAEIGNNLRNYEEQKWKTLMKHVQLIFNHDFSKDWEE